MAGFPQFNYRKAFRGSVLLSQQDASGAATTVFAFPFSSFVFQKMDNNGYIPGIDAASQTHLKSAGIREGMLDIVTPIMADRGIHSFLNQNFGPRTASSLILPSFVNFKSTTADSYSKASGLYPIQASIMGRSAKQGAAAQLMLRTTFVVCDPDDALALTPSLTAPGTLGTSGLGVSSFSRASYSDGAGTPTLYDGITAFSTSFNNGMTWNGAVYDPVNRIGAGYAPSAIKGAVTVQQNFGATNVIPKTAGGYPFNLIMPSGDGTHTLTIAHSLSYDQDSVEYAPEEFVQGSEVYTLFGGNATNGTTGYPFIASYV